MSRRRGDMETNFDVRSFDSHLPLEEYREGMATPITFDFPRASTAMAATRLESSPPERPINTFLKPFFRM